jgi:curved DNA-binding protein CbpA
MAERTYYDILRVTPQAEPEVIESAYRRLARMYHPDVSDSPDCTRVMQEINEAYEVLCDPLRRERYDESLRAVEEERQAASRPFDAAAYLQENGLEVIDKRPSGCLWVVSPPDSDLTPVMEELRAKGCEFRFAERGGKATGRRPAWWMK